MPSAYGGKFDAAVRKLRKSGLADRPFRVITLPATDKRIKGLYGFYTNDKIYIVRGLSHSIVIDCLLHEYSHFLDQQPGETVNIDHRVSWGATYARVYQFYFGRT